MNNFLTVKDASFDDIELCLRNHGQAHRIKPGMINMEGLTIVRRVPTEAPKAADTDLDPDFIRVRNLLGEFFGIENSTIEPDAWLVKNLGADSLDLVEIVMMIEDEFRIEIYDEMIETEMTDGDIRVKDMLKIAPIAEYFNRAKPKS